jgi:hypothetical protein
MSITDTMPKNDITEALNEVLSIQAAAYTIATNKVKTKLMVNKTDVTEEVFMYLSAYFKARIVPVDPIYKTEKYLVIRSGSCDIIINVKTN